MASYPLCSTPSNVAVSYPGPNSVLVQWEGPATFYKIAYKLESDSDWIIQSQSGPGSTAGSGLFADDTGGDPTVTSANPSASFTINSLSPGIYDLQIINICNDGTSYVRKMKFFIEENVGIIPNLELVEDLDEFNINITWNHPQIDSGNPILISWCRVNRFGQKLDCDGDQVEHDVTAFNIPNPGPGLWMIFVAQQATNGFQYAVSNAIYVSGTECENDMCRYEPFVPEESESSI